MGNEARLDRVRQHVLEGGTEMLLVMDHPGGEALREEGASTAMAGVVLSRIVALEPLDRAREVFGSGGYDGVVVRAHQAVGVEREPEAGRGSMEQRQEHPPVRRIAEQHRLVDAARRHVEVAVRKLGAEDSRHGADAR